MDLDSIHNKKSHIDKTAGYMNIYHQNIRRLATKLGELISHLHPHYLHILCITEHHLKQQQMKHITTETYNLGASYCRNQFEKGGGAIFVHKNIQYSNINIDKYCKEKDIEICALKFAYHKLKICIITLYRSPTGDMDFFLSKLDRVLHIVYNLTHHIIICGDINVDYLVESERKKQLDNLLLSLNLTSIIKFPTRIQNTSATAIDNMFLDSSRLKDHLVTPIYNGLSDHDAQLLTIRIKVHKDPIKELKTHRNFNKHTISEFINILSNESWDMYLIIITMKM